MLSTLAKSAVRPVSKVVRNAALSTAAAKPKEREAKPPVESKSFVMNLFRGRAVNEQVFPYPLKLDDDQRETLNMFMAPTEKFFEEVNDVVK
ncbi:hypothetical protein OSTOST_10280 [Ostertagia ostertagi]